MSQPEQLPKVRRGEIAAGLRGIIEDQAKHYPTQIVHVDGLAVMQAAEDELARMIGATVGRLRRDGMSWAELGKLTGLTPQGAQQRWKAYAPIERKRAPKGETNAE